MIRDRHVFSFFEFCSAWFKFVIENFIVERCSSSRWNWSWTEQGKKTTWYEVLDVLTSLCMKQVEESVHFMTMLAWFFFCSYLVGTAKQCLPKKISWCSSTSNYDGHVKHLARNQLLVLNLFSSWSAQYNVLFFFTCSTLVSWAVVDFSAVICLRQDDKGLSSYL